MLLADGSLPLIVVDSAKFDGSSAFLSRGSAFTGEADSKQGIFSCWTRLDGGNGVELEIVETTDGANEGVVFYRSSANKFTILAYNSSGTVVLLTQTSSTYTSGSTWRHFLSSWDLAAGVSNLYINDVSDQSVTTRTDDTIDYTKTICGIGALPGGGSKFNGCMAELYFAPGQYLDFSVAINRRKFISSSGKPVALGTTGASPTGTVPLIYLHLDDGETASHFATNRTGNGDLGATGSLTTGTSSPSD